MNNLQIEYFLAVAENLSFSKTAAEKFVSQPAISKHISALEAEFGVTLFERSNRNVKITEAGRLFADFFVKQQQTINQLTQMVQKTNMSQIIPLRVGCTSSWNMESFMPAIINNIAQNHPNIKIILESNHITGLAATLLSNDADIAIALATSLHTSPQLNIHKLTTVPHVIIFSKSHRCADKEVIVPSDFKDDIFFVPSPDEVTHIVELVKNYCEPHGFIPTIQGVKNFESLILSVANGLGVAVADSWVGQTYRTLRSIDLDSYHDIAVAWKNNNDNPAIPVFLHELARHFYPEGGSGFDRL